MFGLQSTLCELKAGKAQVLRSLIPGIRNETWNSLLEEIEGVVEAFDVSNRGGLRPVHSRECCSGAGLHTP